MMFMDFAIALLLLPNTSDYFPIDKFQSGKCLLEIHSAFIQYCWHTTRICTDATEDRTRVCRKFFLVL